MDEIRELGRIAEIDEQSRNTVNTEEELQALDRMLVEILEEVMKGE